MAPVQKGKVMEESVVQEIIEKKIFIIRGENVMLSTHLAEMYGVEIRALVQAVKRNSDRFPDDFMFLLTDQEVTILKSQIVISRPRSQIVTLNRDSTWCSNL